MALINGTPGDDILNGTPGDDTILGEAGNDTLRGKAGNDRLEGGTGRDKLFGGDGSDRLFGGDGNDLLNPGDNTGDDIINAGKGKDKIVLSQALTGYVGIDQWDLDARITVNIDGNTNTATIKKAGAGTTTIIDIVNPMLNGGLGISGTAYDDAFNITVANGGWMTINGGRGVDSYNIGASTGSVRLDFRDFEAGATGVEVDLATGVIADDGYGNAEMISGTGKVWEVRSSMQDDTITGSANDESFILMAGNDLLDGGGGYDRLRYDRTGVDGVTVDLGTGIASGLWRGEAFVHTISNIERVLGSIGDDTLRGGAGDDRLEGRDGDDTLRGGAGNDRLEGGAGKDKLFGGDGSDKLYGGDGNDLLNPGNNTGGDTITAGKGKDKIVLKDISTGYVQLEQGDLDARITVNIDGNTNTATIKKAGAGTTTITDIINPMQADGLGVGGTAFDDVFNITVVDGGWMLINGSTGADTYNIGASTGTIRLDLRDYTGTGTGVDVNLATGVIADDGYGNVDTITGRIREVRATMQDDTITGSANNDRFILMAGNDTLDGGAGYDALRYDRTGVDGVTVDLGAGTASGTWSGEAFVHTISNIEEVRGSAGDDILKGSDAQGDWLEGRDGDDVIKGGGGNDTLDGGAGYDTLRYDQTGVNGVTVDLGAGTASVTWSNVAFVQTISNIEAVRGSNGDDGLTGGIGDDRLEGRNGNDVIKGGAGKDKLFGGKGNDLVQGEAGNDTLKGDGGKDRLIGGDGKDKLIGGGGNDRLLGGKGNDRLDGGAGNDRMTGGKGNDTFVFGTGDDVVTDFNAANNKEKIDLSGVGAITGFNNLKNNFLTEVAGNVVIDDGAGNTLTLNGLDIADLNAGDFIF